VNKTTQIKGASFPLILGLQTDNQKRHESPAIESTAESQVTAKDLENSNLEISSPFQKHELNFAANVSRWLY
jgi:hypothetical protein